jgi:hypothetical protein
MMKHSSNAPTLFLALLVMLCDAGCRNPISAPRSVPSTRAEDRRQDLAEMGRARERQQRLEHARTALLDALRHGHTATVEAIAVEFGYGEIHINGGPPQPTMEFVVSFREPAQVTLDEDTAEAVIVNAWDRAGLWPASIYAPVRSGKEWLGRGYTLLGDATEPPG